MWLNHRMEAVLSGVLDAAGHNHARSDSMVQRQYQKLLIRPEDVSSSQDALEVIGTFNPGVTEHEGEVVILVRVAERPLEHRQGYTPLPTWHEEQVVTEWVANDDLEVLDSRVVRLKSTELLRLTSTSHLRVVRSSDGRNIDHFDGPSFLPEEPWEEYGIEDPRIVFLDERYWITYVAVSRHGPATALASTHDFVSFQRHGIIFCPENKDVVLFPEQIGGQFVALHRPATAHPFCRPEIWLARSPDLIHWGSHTPLYGSTGTWETDRVGGGAPPVLTPAGWLEIYHASRRSEAPGQVGTYTAGTLLLNVEDPSHVIAHSEMPLWEPDTDYELSGFVPSVIFPTGVVVRDDILQLYYGAADTHTAMVEFLLADLTL